MAKLNVRLIDNDGAEKNFLVEASKVGAAQLINYNGKSFAYNTIKGSDIANMICVFRETGTGPVVELTDEELIK